MDVPTSERSERDTDRSNPDLDLVRSGDIEITFVGPKQVVKPAKTGRHEAQEEDI